MMRFWLQSIILMAILCLGWTVRLPNYVARLLNNQGVSEVKDVLVPLTSVNCPSYADAAVCYQVGIKELRNLIPVASRIQFQVNLPRVLRGRMICLGTFVRGEQRNSIVCSRVDGKDMRLDLNWNYEVIQRLIEGLDRRREFVGLVLECENCGDTNNAWRSSVKIEEIAFLVGLHRNNMQKRNRNLEDQSQSTCIASENSRSCCVENLLVARDVIFRNWTLIVAPLTIPLTFCTGSCHIHRVRGSHNYGVIQYHNHLLDTNASRRPGYRQMIRPPIPCCSARQFSDLYVLFRLHSGINYLQSMSNMLVKSCDCY